MRGIGRVAPLGEPLNRRCIGVGSSGKPQPIGEAEAARILKTKEEAAAGTATKAKVTRGNFPTFSGMVEELDYDKNRVKVSISIFGRAAPLELAFEDVEHLK